MADKLDLNNILTNVAVAAVRSVAQNDTTPELHPAAAPAVIDAVTTQLATSPEVQKAAAAVAQATTPVPWYQSKVFVGVGVSLISVVVGVTTKYTIPQEVQPEIANAIIEIGSAVGSLIAMFGRLTSNLAPITATKQ